MKKIALFLAFVMTVAAVAMPLGTAADGEPKFVPIFDFDTVTATSANYDSPTIDTGNHLNGEGCYTLKTDLNGAHPSVPLLEAKFNPVDISDCDYLCFWLWLESADLATKFTAGRIELNSSGVHNEKTDIWIATGNASAWPHSVIANMIEGGAKDGWNLVRIPLDSSKFAIYHDNADRTHINYFRLYGDNANLKGKTIKLDYMYAYQEGATVPEPSKASTGTEEPVVKEPVFVKIFDFDTVTATSANYDAPTIDAENHLNGEGCYTLKTDPNGAHPSVPILEAKFDPVDISNCDYLCFWLWLESADLAAKFTGGRIELNSSGVHNEKTDIWIATGNASAWPHSVIANMIEGGAKAGWNLVRIPLDSSKFAVYHDLADRTHINYFRLFGDNGALKNKTIKLDYMYAYSEGTTVPEPDRKGAINPGTDDPGTDDPGTDDPGTDDPGTDDPGTDDPGTDDPGTDDPGTDNPGTDDPGADDPGTDDPGTDNPGTEEPVVKGPVFVKIFDFDTVTATSTGYDAPTIDTENHLNGEGCYTLKTDLNGAHPSVPLLEAKFDPVDISNCDYLCFWLWLESADLATKFTSGRIELNSSGVHNEKTDIWIATGNAGAWPHSVIANMIEGGAKDGWNLVRIPLDTSKFAIYHDSADRTHINYFRLYGDNANLKGKTIKLDYMYAYTEGAEVPAPQNNPAPETQAPETQAPETQAPETKVPETKTPETKAPETKAPETKTPGTEASGTDVPATQDPSTQPAEDPEPMPVGAIIAVAVAAIAIIGVIFVIIKKKH